jgi:hypothetical protein
LIKTKGRVLLATLKSAVPVILFSVDKGQIKYATDFLRVYFRIVLFVANPTRLIAFHQ